MRKYLQRVSMFDRERSLPIEREVERLLKDDKPVVGVSYHPGKRKWRAYIYSGRKQIAHTWCETKREAITARMNMVSQHGKPRVLVQGKDVPYRAFPRTVPAPKGFVLEDVLIVELRELSNLQSLCQVAITQGMRFRRGYKRSVRERMGNAVGKVLTVIEMLSMSGEIKVEHIEAGMLMMAEELSGKNAD